MTGGPALLHYSLTRGGMCEWLKQAVLKIDRSAYVQHNLNDLSHFSRRLIHPKTTIILVPDTPETLETPDFGLETLMKQWPTI
jgi:hypothetical protein